MVYVRDEICSTVALSCTLLCVTVLCWRHTCWCHMVLFLPMRQLVAHEALCDVEVCNSFEQKQLFISAQVFYLSHRKFETVLRVVTYSFYFFSSGSVYPADDGTEECRGESLVGVCEENECEFVEDSCETECDDTCSCEGE